MVMRPYQVCVQHGEVHRREQRQRLHLAHHRQRQDADLFKASTCSRRTEYIHKCLFVVDRKDLDRQTREEFNKFQEGCVEEKHQHRTPRAPPTFEDYADKVIVTTIQKLGLALDENSIAQQQRSKNGAPPTRSSLTQDKRMVFIFDECHRFSLARTTRPSKFFPKAQLSVLPARPSFGSNATLRESDRRTEGWRYQTTEELVPEAAPRLHHHPRH